MVRLLRKVKRTLKEVKQAEVMRMPGVHLRFS